MVLKTCAFLLLQLFPALLFAHGVVLPACDFRRCRVPPSCFSSRWILFFLRNYPISRLPFYPYGFALSALPLCPWERLLLVLAKFKLCALIVGGAAFSCPVLPCGVPVSTHPQENMLLFSRISPTYNPSLQ